MIFIVVVTIITNVVNFVTWSWNEIIIVFDRNKQEALLLGTEPRFLQWWVSAFLSPLRAHNM